MSVDTNKFGYEGFLSFFKKLILYFLIFGFVGRLSIGMNDSKFSSGDKLMIFGGFFLLPATLTLFFDELEGYSKGSFKKNSFKLELPYYKNVFENKLYNELAAKNFELQKRSHDLKNILRNTESDLERESTEIKIGKIAEKIEKNDERLGQISNHYKDIRIKNKMIFENAKRDFYDLKESVEGIGERQRAKKFFKALFYAGASIITLGMLCNVHDLYRS